VIQRITDATAKELSSARDPLRFRAANTWRPRAGRLRRPPRAARAQGTSSSSPRGSCVDGVETLLDGAATGRSTRSCSALRDGAGFDVHVLNYHEHGVGAGEDATAVAYVQLRVGGSHTVYGSGSIPTSSRRRCAPCSPR
jgi:2-isopropylmalate synthase